MVLSRERRGSGLTQGSGECDRLALLAGNTIYNADGELKGTKICDPTTKVEKSPSDDAIIALGKKAIGWV